MKRASVWIGTAIFGISMACGTVLAQAPDSYPPADPDASPPAPRAVDISSAILEWTPPALAQLSTQAVAKESFTLDRTMLAAAAGMMSDSDDGVRQAIHKLDGVSVHLLRFGAPDMVDPGQLEAIRQAYHGRGWKHVVSAARADDAEHDNTTDVWVVMDGTNVRGAVVLFETPKSLTLATVAGNLDPIDLLHLRGHFGIPRFDGDRLNSERR